MPCTSTCIHACNGAVHISNDAGLRPVLQVSTSIYLYPCIQVIHSTSTQVLGPAATATQPAQAAPFRSPATQNFLFARPASSERHTVTPSHNDRTPRQPCQARAATCPSAGVPRLRCPLRSFPRANQRKHSRSVRPRQLGKFALPP